MAINTTIKTNILKGITGLGSAYIGGDRCYLALLSKAPGVDGKNFVECKTVKADGETANGYERKLICYTNQQERTAIKVEEDPENQGKIVATNVDAIYFGECLETNSWVGTDDGALKYYGLFSSKTGTVCMAWERIKNADGAEMTLNPAEGQIPTIRIEDLKITLD